MLFFGVCFFLYVLTSFVNFRPPTFPDTTSTIKLSFNRRFSYRASASASVDRTEADCPQCRKVRGDCLYVRPSSQLNQAKTYCKAS